VTSWELSAGNEGDVVSVGELSIPPIDQLGMSAPTFSGVGCFDFFSLCRRTIMYASLMKFCGK
jgi:hypothetical protein